MCQFSSWATTTEMASSTQPTTLCGATGLEQSLAQNDYDVWRSHFGQTLGSGSGATGNAAVPEPATLMLMMFAVAGWCLRRGRAA